jgi:Rieske Fe-S protein
VSAPTEQSRAAKPVQPTRTRRSVLALGGAAGVALTLGGCSVYGDSTGDGSAGAAPAATGQAGAALAKTSEIPVGGGKIFKAASVVVTQPTAGAFKAFSAVCTHQGCLVTEVKDGTINCPCHGSKFAIADGSVDSGPAPKPLPPKTVTVQGDSIRLA